MKKKIHCVLPACIYVATLSWQVAKSTCASHCGVGQNSSRSSHQHLPSLLDGLLQEKIQRIYQGVKSLWLDSRLAKRTSHTAAGGPHKHGQTLQHSDMLRHCSCFPAYIFMMVWAHWKCLRNCLSRQKGKDGRKKERKKKPKHQPKQALSGIVHQCCASTQIKQQSSIYLHYIEQLGKQLNLLSGYAGK